jgi:hypothetical protein
VIGELLAAYDHLVGERSTNNDLSTRFFIQRIPQFRLHNERRQLAEVTIYPKDYFDFPVLWGPGEYSMHLFMGSWRLLDLHLGDGVPLASLVFGWRRHVVPIHVG